MKQSIFISSILILLLSGCMMNNNSKKEDIKNITTEYQENSMETENKGNTEDNVLMAKELTREKDITSSNGQERIPCTKYLHYKDVRNNPGNSIYAKDFYQYITEGLYMNVRIPDRSIEKNLDDYFPIEYDTVQSIYPLTSIIFDNRTIEMSEEDLKALFYKHGYYLYLHNAEVGDLHIRLLELQEIDGLSLYPSRILMQTWNDDVIFAKDITGPIPRKIRSLFPVEGGTEPRLIIHSSGFSVDYIVEEELSFWVFLDSGWTLSEMQLDIDTGNAHNIKDYDAEIDRDTLFPATYYSDGITYRSSIQSTNTGRGTSPKTYRLGKLEVIEKNKKFKLVPIFENLGVTETAYGDCYIEFTIK